MSAGHLPRSLRLLLWAEVIIILLLSGTTTRGAELNVGAGVMFDGNYDYERDRDEEFDNTSLHETASLVVQFDLPGNVKYGWSHTSQLLEIDSDYGENILYVSYQASLIRVIKISAGIGLIDNEGSAYKEGFSQRRNNPVFMLTWVNPLGPVLQYRLAYTVSFDAASDRYSTLYGGIEYRYDL